MDIRLERQDLLQVGAISELGTLKLLPLGKKNKQKMVIGDDSGRIYCYEFDKKREPKIVFEREYFKSPVACIALSFQKSDNIFIASRQTIYGINKKGNEPHYTLVSNFTENIKQLLVDDAQQKIWASYETIFNTYKQNKEEINFQNHDSITCVAVSQITTHNDMNVLVGCKDSRVRVLQGGNVILDIPTTSAVSSLAVYDVQAHVLKRGPTYLITGQESGIISLVKIDRASEDGSDLAGSGGADGLKYTNLWEITVDGDSRSVVNSIKVFDLNQDGLQEIIVSRENGSLSVYRFGKDGLGKAQILEKPILAFYSEIGERIQSIDCGCINNPDFKEVVVAGFSGKIYSFTTEPILKRDKDDQYGRSVQTVQNEHRIKSLVKEIEELTKKVDKEKEEVKRNPSLQAANRELSPPEELSVIHSFSLNPLIAAYELSIELQASIDIVVIRSQVPLDFIETDIGSAVLSTSPALIGGPGQADVFVYSFRCQSKEKRIGIKIRTIEGRYGLMSVTIVSDEQPKRAKVIPCVIKPLSLHTKVYSLTKTETSRPTNSITFTNTVSSQIILQDWHDILEEIFPGIPTIDSGNSDLGTQEKYYYRNTFTGAVATISYKRNECIITSESASTIKIVNENFTRITSERRKQVDQSVTFPDETVESCLFLLKDKLEDQLSIVRKVNLLDSIEEITLGDSDHSWITAEYADILKNKASIRDAFKNHTKSLGYLVGIVEDLYYDWNKYKGIDVSEKRSRITAIINSKSFDFNELIRVILSG